MQHRSTRPGAPAGGAIQNYTHERWHRNGFNLCEAIIIRDGPDEKGRRYVDGRHQISVGIYDTPEDAERACAEHNERCLA